MNSPFLNKRGHATQYYEWQEQLFENAESAFARRPNKANLKRQQNAHEKKIVQLGEKRLNRNELDGYSRFIGHWAPLLKKCRESMTEQDVETIRQRAREQFSGETPRIISDNGPQFISKDFKQFIHICERTHMNTSPYYP